MSGEPEPTDLDKLGRALLGARMMWLVLFAGAVAVTGTIAILRFMPGNVVMEPGLVGCAFLAFVPLGLTGAYVIAPLLVRRDAATAARKGRGFPGWEGTTPDDPYYWLPAYVAAFTLRAGILETTAIVVVIGFFVTGSWVVLVGVGVLVLGLAFELPTRAGVESFAARRRAGASA